VEATVQLPPQCYAEVTGDNTTDYSSADAQAVRNAAAAASAGGTVKIAGTCAGVSNGAVLSLTKALRFVGGYTNTNWLAAPDAATYTTTLDAQSAGRVIYSTQALTLENLLVRNGSFDGASAVGSGGGVYAVGPALISNTTLISNSTSSLTSASGGGGFFEQTLTMRHSRVVENASGLGAGLVVVGAIEVTDTDFADNLSVKGGAMVLNGGGVISNVTLSHNYAVNGGGGVYFLGTAPYTVTNALVSENYCGDGPGAFWFDGGMQALVQNSRIYSNTSQSSTSVVNMIAVRAGAKVTLVNNVLARKVNYWTPASSAADIFVLTGGSLTGAQNTFAAGTNGAGYAVVVDGASSRVALTNSLVSGYANGAGDAERRAVGRRDDADERRGDGERGSDRRGRLPSHGRAVLRDGRRRGRRRGQRGGDGHPRGGAAAGRAARHGRV
jgi:hypothetical protein